MINMKIHVDNNFYQIIDCKNWRVKNLQPNCSLDLDLNQCDSCQSRVPRNGDFESPPIFTITVGETEKIVKEEKQIEPTFAEKAKSYIKAETSQAITGKVSQEVFEKRKAICMSCDYRIEQHKTFKDSIGWCKGGCGCSLGNQRAALSQKLYMPTLSCPKGKFGKEKGEGFNIGDAADSIKGVITSVKNLFEKDK